jgi:hypothetical protein
MSYVHRGGMSYLILLFRFVYVFDILKIGTFFRSDLLEDLES